MNNNELDNKLDKHNTAEYIKEKLGATVIATSLIPQDNGSDIVMEQCEIDDKYKLVLVYDDNDKAVIVC